MPGPWNQAQRDKYEATIVSRRLAAREFAERPRSIGSGNGEDLSGMLPVALTFPTMDEVLERLDAVEDSVGAIRTMLVDVHSMVALMRATQREVVESPAQAVRRTLGEWDLPSRLDILATSVTDVRKAVGRVESRPCKVVEFRLDSRRVKDGGSTAQDQRRAARRGLVTLEA